MKTNFDKIQQAICTTCELYIPSPEGEWAIHVDACTDGIAAALEQKTPDRKWVPCAFFSQKLEGKPGQGRRGWSVRQQESDAIVACPLQFTSWFSGRKVTILSDHKTPESWYKEAACTESGPLGRRGRLHKSLSRYNIAVVYQPEPDNQVAEGLSCWAYPAGLAEHSTLHGPELGLDWVQKKERELLEREEMFLTQQQIPEIQPTASVAQVVSQFRGDRLQYLIPLHLQSMGALLPTFLSYSTLLLANGVAFSMVSRSAPPKCTPAFPDVAVCSGALLPPLMSQNMARSVTRRAHSVPWRRRLNHCSSGDLIMGSLSIGRAMRYISL